MRKLQTVLFGVSLLVSFLVVGGCNVAVTYLPQGTFLEKYNLMSPKVQEAFDKMVTGNQQEVLILYPARVSLQNQPAEIMLLYIAGVSTDNLTDALCKKYIIGRRGEIREEGVVCKHHALTSNDWVHQSELRTSTQTLEK